MQNITIAIKLTSIADADFGCGLNIGQVTSSLITEASSLAASRVHRNVLYTHSDSGGKARLFAIDGWNGRHLATFTVTGAENHDWEDIAVGPRQEGLDSCIYIADTGGNAWSKANTVYRVKEPWELKNQAVPVESELKFQ